MAYNRKLQSKYAELERLLQANLTKSSIWFIRFLVLFMTSSIKVGAITLTHVGKAMDNSALPLSNVRLIQRYLYEYQWCQRSVTRLIMALLPPQGDTAGIFLLDKTSWKFGGMEYNILILARSYQGIALPVMWSLLDHPAGEARSGLGKDGASTQSERMALITRFEDIFGPGILKLLLADREFIGNEWFAFLHARKIRFAIRIRNNAQVFWKGKARPISAMFESLKVNQQVLLRKPRNIYGHRLYLTAARFINRQNQPELIIVAALTYTPALLALYLNRWQIECMFKSLKSAGFNIEDTHIESLQAFDKLLYFISLAFIWAAINGLELAKTKPIKILKHGRKQVSIFTLGLQDLQVALLRKEGPNLTFRLKLSYTYGATFIWDSVEVKADWFKHGLTPSRDLARMPADFREFYGKFAADSALQRASVNDARVVAVISECDTIIRLNSKNWEYDNWNFLDDFNKENNTNEIDGWDNTFYSDTNTFYVEFRKKEIGMIYRFGFERIDGRWQLTLYFVEVC